MGYDWISFLTDYGCYDGFVAACHGAMGRVAPAARVLDVTHDVPPGDIRRGAVVLAQAVPYLPAAVHVAVVDPGVGTARLGVALRAPGGVLVGPDNGLLGWAADALGGVEEAVSLTDASYHLSTVMATFHGRDIFAPVAAHVAAGVPIGRLGPAVDPAGLARLPRPLLRVTAGEVAGEVLTLDRYGNVQTSATAADAVAAGFGAGDPVEVVAGGTTYRMPHGTAFGDVPRDRLLSYVDSYGMLAVAVNGGNAGSRLRLMAGDPVTLRTVSP